MRTTTIIAASLALSAAGSTLAQDRAAVERALLQRQQQSDEFALRLRQGVRELSPAPATSVERAQLNAAQIDQRMRQEALHQQQLQRLDSSTAIGSGADSMPIGRQAQILRMEQERQMLMQRLQRDDPPARTSAEPPARWGPRLE